MSDHRRFHIEGKPKIGSIVTLNKEYSKQVVGVLRMKPGESVTLLDGAGAEYPSVILSTKISQVNVRIDDVRVPAVESPVKIILAMGRIKPAKLEFVLQKGTELGVSQFLLMECANSIGITPDAKRMARWEKIIIEAMEQCGGVQLPALSSISLKEVSELIPGTAAALLAHEHEEDTLITDALDSICRNILSSPAPGVGTESSVMLITGPEGGFREDEISLLLQGGAQSVSLGPRILRAETAAIAGCATVVLAMWSNRS